MNCKRKSRRRFFLLMRSRTPPISSEFRGGGLKPPTPLGTPLLPHTLNCLGCPQTQSVRPGLRGTIVQASSCRHITTETQIRSQCSQCGTVDGHSGTVHFSLQLDPFSAHCQCQPTNSPYFLIQPSQTLCTRGADKSLARPGRKQATATEDFEFYISYL